MSNYLQALPEYDENNHQHLKARIFIRPRKLEFQGTIW